MPVPSTSKEEFKKVATKILNYSNTLNDMVADIILGDIPDHKLSEFVDSDGIYYYAELCSYQKDLTRIAEEMLKIVKEEKFVEMLELSADYFKL
jgi:hypothetical protein